jgi:hypothetical protein
MQVLGPKDRAFLVVVGGHKVRLLTDLTGSVDELLGDLGGVKWLSRNGETLYDACEGMTTLVRIVTCDHPLWHGSRFRDAPKYLTRLSEETGGRAYLSPGRSPTMFAEIENDLRSMYVLGFVPPEEAGNGEFRKLELKVADPSLRVRARPGYSVSQGSF